MFDTLQQYHTMLRQSQASGYPNGSFFNPMHTGGIYGMNRTSGVRGYSAPPPFPVRVNLNRQYMGRQRSSPFRALPWQYGQQQRAAPQTHTLRNYTYTPISYPTSNRNSARPEYFGPMLGYNPWQ